MKTTINSPGTTELPTPTSSASPGFSLRALVVEVLESTDLADPGEIADEVARRIRKAQMPEALRQALRPFVREVATQARMHRPAEVPPRPARSAKVAAIRDAWQRHLHDRIHVGESVWKLLRDCTHEDLKAAAEERRALAEQNAAKAAHYERLAGLLDEHDAATVGELPPAVLATALGGAS